MFLAHRPPFADHGVAWAKKHSTYSTYSTFQQKEAFFSEPYIQHDSTYSNSTFQQKEALFLKKSLSQGKNPTWPKKWFFQQKEFNMVQKVVLSAVKKFNMAQKVVLSAEKFNMCRKCVSFC